MRVEQVVPFSVFQFLPSSKASRLLFQVRVDDCVLITRKLTSSTQFEASCFAMSMAGMKTRTVGRKINWVL